ncbi:MAG: HAD family hydrolase [Patescibacteria group bacterium]|nr:HAD family hydrolase [Patescibacteria group bacterium]
MIKAIIFDFDGVIADTFRMSLDILAERKRIIPEKIYRDFHEGNVYESTVLSFTREETRYFWASYHEKISKEHLFPIEKQIIKLAKKHKLFIISSSREKVIDKFLYLTRIAKCFDKILGEKTHKSKVEKFKIIFKKYALKPEECIFVTDTLEDLREAKKVGVSTIAVTWGYHGKSRLKKGSPNAMIHDFRELIGAVEKLRKFKT